MTKLTGPSRTEALVDLPAYSLPRAAHIVQLSPSTLRQWAVGDLSHKPLFRPVSREPLALSFSNLVESFVLASMRRVHGISMQKVRKALRFVGTRLGHERPLVHVEFQTDGVSLFVEHADRLLNVSSEGQAALREVLRESLQRIEWEDDLAVRVYPWVRSGDLASQPRNIVCDLRRGFGQPTIAGTGIDARIVAERHRAGESVGELARDYGVGTDPIEDAIRCETREAA